MTDEPLRFKPYARLLTMLGDQLIRNEQVALAELIKNSYDADASWVKVSFNDFDENFRPGPAASIVIEDDGLGMSSELIRNHWVNPATPVKRLGKKSNQRTTPSGRIIQGEKGIGRFALLKLGRDIRMTTRPTGAADENVVGLKLAAFDEDFLKDDRAMFLDELEISLNSVSPAVTIVEGDVDLGGRKRVRRPHGTRIEVSPPIGSWSRAKVEKVFEDLARLQTIFGSDFTQGAIDASDDVDTAELSDPVEDVGRDASAEEASEDFIIYIYRNGLHEPFGTEMRGRLATLIAENSVFRIEGNYIEATRTFEFNINGRFRILHLDDAAITGMAVFRDFLKRNELKPEDVSDLRTNCGPFGFSFSVFDFSTDAKGPLLLEKDDKEFIKKHRIYLYRDGVRVYPYGDPDDDWLLIDVRRGTVRASEFLSNDQVVGYVSISQEDNEELRDKTSREGLVDTGKAVDDFRSLLQVFLAWVRKDPYQHYQIARKQSGDVEVFKSGRVQDLMDAAVEASSAEGVPASVRNTIAQASRDYRTERRYLVQRAENTEHLAGVGLSVEAASHDLMIALHRALSNLDRLSAYVGSDATMNREVLTAELLSLRGLLSFVQTQMSDVQLLFRSSKQRRKNVRVLDLVEKVANIFRGLLERNHIVVTVETIGSPLVAKTTDAVLLQLMLNLFDNAVYWLQGSPPPREIEILLDSESGTMTFADSGPGFRDEDLPYLFEPFYSGKGEEGRGLGLYIARQLLERHGYTLAVAEKEQRVLKGANLIVSFVKEEK
ncbi:ATP-binding protein [Aurantimonas sp. 22II-16-19i]|uniref:ATP-binding protein n=1 Tax=Aurantimonas sp. 22II-16-19i TaxID=1317114 RepID=UPI0009F7D1D2|nr:ATP-binding protein [Aurantimonas sp. 22II-16-19i]ORE89770.1 histidine kinase [Aurantimonas sp. 22II-16-19i]